MNSTDSSCNSTYEGDNSTDIFGHPWYDPKFPVAKWHQNLEMIFVCVFNALTLLVICARTYIRLRKQKRLRADDQWIIAAGLIIAFPFWPSQIAANHYGSGLYWKNIHNEDRKYLWITQTGWLFYFIISSMIKISICFCHLLIVPAHLVYFRRFIYTLCFFIMSLGIIEASLWAFDCSPFKTNFDYDYVPPPCTSKCINLDGPRYVWLGVSVFFDILILYIPFRILKETSLQKFERKILMLVFGANLLGTATCFVGLYGIWEDRQRKYDYVETAYSQAPFVMTNVVEVFFYTLGASFPVLSPYLISWGKDRSTRQRSSPSVLPSWRRKLTTVDQLHPDDNNNNNHPISNTNPDSDSMIEMNKTTTINTDNTNSPSITKPERKYSTVGGDRVQGWTLAMKEDDDLEFGKPGRFDEGIGRAF